jgi:hypothetical protein
MPFLAPSYLDHQSMSYTNQEVQIHQNNRYIDVYDTKNASWYGDDGGSADTTRNTRKHFRRSPGPSLVFSGTGHKSESPNNAYYGLKPSRKILPVKSTSGRAQHSQNDTNAHPFKVFVDVQMYSRPGSYRDKEIWIDPFSCSAIHLALCSNLLFSNVFVFIVQYHYC